MWNKLRINYIWKLVLPFLFIASPCAAEKPDQYILMISFDGFRADYLDWYDTPNFDRLIQNGFRAKGLKPVFVTKTFPNHYSIATGMYSESHGIISNEFYDYEFNDTYCLCKPEAVADPRWYGGEPIWVTAEKQGVKTASFYWVGSATPINGVLPGITKRYDESVSFDTRVDSVATWFSLQENERPNLILLYFHEPDGTGHRFGPRSEKTETMVSSLDTLLGSIMKKMAATPVSEMLNILVVSDHGMIETSYDRVIDFSRTPGMKEFIQEGTGPYSFFYGRKNNLEEAVDLFNQNEHVSAYLKQDIPGQWHYRNNNRIKDILVVADGGWSILDVNEPDSTWVGLGNHGFDNALWGMHGILVGAGPAFKKGYFRSPVENIHIYPLIAEILGLTPAPGIDGSLSKVEDVLSKQRK